MLEKTPVESDLLYSSCGILNALNCITRKSIRYDQFSLLSGNIVTHVFSKDSAQYIEFLLHTIMTISRNRLRLQHKIEADSLDNKTFSEFYQAQYNDCFVCQIAQYKDEIAKAWIWNNNGYRRSGACVLRLADGFKRFIRIAINESAKGRAALFCWELFLKADEPEPEPNLQLSYISAMIIW